MRTITLMAACLLCFTAFAQKGGKEAVKGNEAYKKGEFKQANTHYDQALKKAPDNSTYLFNKGNALAKSGSLAEAKDAYAKAATTSTDKKVQAQSYYNKGVAETRQKNLQEAVNAFKQALRLDPADEEIRQNLQKAMNELKKQQQEQNQQNNKKQQQKPQEQDKDKQQQKKQQPKPEEQKMDKQKAEQLLQQLRNEEKRLQQEVQKQKTRQISPEKDW